MELRLIALGDGYISLQEPAPPENTSELRLFLWVVVLCHRSSPLRAGKNSGPDEPPLGPSNDYIIRSRHGTSPENPQYPSMTARVGCVV